MKVYVVIGQLPQCAAGYNIIGVCSSEEKAEELKEYKELVPGLHSGIKFKSVDVWGPVEVDDVTDLMELR